ncbi:hypothetical protein [Longimicrobium sp.]|uniref:hypothetical protein n=1 Tax=Longimicrobium sp. TaxID=2029185 RepID=UPI002CCC4BE3|nr:hypothetical protein [Longimicrobium sp.]HSU15615.1 hypothetical protein [Longimicrobium sp.]
MAGFAAALGLAACSDAVTNPVVRPGGPSAATEVTLSELDVTTCQYGGEYPNCKPKPVDGGSAGVAPTPSSDPAAPSSGGSGGTNPPPDTAQPCHTGYAMLDDPKVQRRMRELFARSNPDSAMSRRREQGGWLVRLADGTFDVTPFPADWPSDPCQITVPAQFSSPPNTVGMLHSHPYSAGERLTNCPRQPLWNGTSAVLNYSGDTSLADDATMLALRSRYPSLMGIMIDKDHIVAYNGNPAESLPVKRCGY